MSYEELAALARAARARAERRVGDDVLTVLENGIREISGEVRNSLDFHRSQDGGGEVSHVVLSGAAQDIPGFAEALPAPSASRFAAPRSTLDRRASPRRSRRTGSRSRPGLPRRRLRNESRQPDPARQQRGGGSVGAGRSEGAAYAVLALLAGLAVLAFAYGSAHHTISSQTRRSRCAHRAGARRRRRPPNSSRPTRASSRCANSARRPSPARRLALRLGPRLPRIRPRAPARACDLLAQRHDRHGRARAPAPRRPHRHAGASAVASATPPGSVPTFTLTGCATSQAEVARTLSACA